MCWRAASGPWVTTGHAALQAQKHASQCWRKLYLEAFEGFPVNIHVMHSHSFLGRYLAVYDMTEGADEERDTRLG